MLVLVWSLNFIHWSSQFDMWITFPGITCCNNISKTDKKVHAFTSFKKTYKNITKIHCFGVVDKRKAPSSYHIHSQDTIKINWNSFSPLQTCTFWHCDSLADLVSSFFKIIKWHHWFECLAHKGPKRKAWARKRLLQAFNHYR